MKKILALVSVTVMVCFLAAGCEWAGRTTGKTVKGVERGVQKAADKVETGAKKFEKGYKDGKQ